MIVFLRLTEDIKKKSIHPHSIEPVMGLLYSIAITKKLGYNFRYYDSAILNQTDEEIAKDIITQNPSTVFIETKTYTAKEAINISRIIKKNKKNIKIIMIGQQVTVLPEDFIFSNSPIDCGFLGEYELTIKEYLENNENYHNLNHTVYLNNNNNKNYEPRTVDKLDKLGLGYNINNHTNYENKYYCAYPVKKYQNIKWGFMELTRGCPFDCLFCSPTLRISYGKKYRHRSIHIIIKEIRNLLKTGVNCIRFLDDNFINDVFFIRQFCKAIINNKLKFSWVVQSRTDNIDKKTLLLMKKAGCKTICIGVESGSNRILSVLNKRVTTKKLRQDINLIKKTKIWVVCFFMIGNPSETRVEIKKTKKLCQKILPHMIQVAYFTPYPGSKYYEKIPAELKKKFDTYSHYNNIVFNTSKVDTKTLEKIHRRFYIDYFLSLKYLLLRMPQVGFYYLFNINILVPMLKKTVKFLISNRECIIQNKKRGLYNA